MSIQIDTRTTSYIGIAIAVASAIVFGLYPPAARAVYADGGNAVFVIMFTTWVRALSLLAFCLLSRKQIFSSFIDIKTALTGGFFQIGSIICIFVALIYLPGPLVISIMFTYTLLLLFFMAARGQIKLRPYMVITTAISLFGITCVLDIWHLQMTSIIGGLIAFCAAIMAASRIYIYGQLTLTRNPAIIGAEAFLMAALLSLLLWPFFPPVAPLSLNGLLFALLAGLSSAVGTSGMFYGIAILGPFRNGLFTKVEPIATTLFSVFIFHESLSSIQYLGIALVIGSLITYQILEHREQK